MKALSRTAILALHALHLLMRRKDAVSRREIQRSSGFPGKAVRALMPRLRQAGFIRTIPGRGYALAKAPGEIPLEDLLRSVEEPCAPKAPCGGDFDACASRAACVLAPLCRQAEEQFRNTLRTFTLAELMNLPPGLPNCLDPKLRAEAS
jgi:Rrf2 family protein